jgi:hypothetical protein
MKKVTCPNCQTENPGSKLICENCGADLTGIERYESIEPQPAADEGTLEPTQAETVPPAATTNKPLPNESSNKPGRGGCLTAFLILAIIGNSLTGLYYLYTGISNVETERLIVFLLPFLVSVLAVVFAIAMWKFKKWGVYGYAGLLIINAILNLLAGGWTQLLATAIGLVILLYLFKKPVWDDFT